MCEVSPTGFGQCVCAPEEHCKGHKKEVIEVLTTFSSIVSILLFQLLCYRTFYIQSQF